ncbi:MAG: T9SS type A sorting domain-containing protein [Chlorobi bacterium]|nr:T9SS type A sorting domain-containing protein [Chlorobiota bacterium]
MRFQIFILFVLSVLISVSGYGQISYGGMPSGFKSDTYTVNLHGVPPAVKAGIMDDTDKRVTPFKFAYSYKTNLSCDNDGEWYNLPDGGRLWRLKIKSEGAKSLNIIFKRYKIPEGGRLFVYSPDKKTVLGAFTDRNNKPSGVLAIAPVPGDEIVIEYSDDGYVPYEPELIIGSINHDYLGVYGYINDQTKAGWFGDSGDCNVNVNCSDFIPDSIQRAVCKIIVDGSMLCSGTLINNTRNDGTPYFLTAAHCLTSANSDQSIIFYFNYETPECISFVEGTKIQTLSGSALKAQVDTLDFALVEIDNMPPATYRPFWAGWNISEAPPAPFVSIHHPQGDVKKVSLENDDLIATTFNANDVNGDPFVQDAHWLVETWEQGTTEGGSSGGGIFDSGAHLVGTLSGGEAYCGNSVNDYFARFNKMWDYLQADNQQVKIWLDPDNTGTTVLSGYDYYNNQTKRLSHLTKNDTVVILKDEGMTGYWSGHNSIGITDYAEYYGNITSATVNGVYVIFGVRQIGADDTVTVKLWSGGYGKPETVLAEKKIAVLSLPQNRENLIYFDQPVSISGSFYAGLEINYGVSETDTVALYQVQKTAGDLTENGFMYDGESWKKLSDVHPDGVRSNYWIDVLASDVTITDVTGNEPDNISDDVSVYPVPVRDKMYFKTRDDLLFVEIYNIGGAKVSNITFGRETTSGYVNTSGLSAGIYLVRFVFSNKTVAKKIVIR